MHEDREQLAARALFNFNCKEVGVLNMFNDNSFPPGPTLNLGTTYHDVVEQSGDRREKKRGEETKDVCINIAPKMRPNLCVLQVIWCRGLVKEEEEKSHILRTWGPHSSPILRSLGGTPQRPGSYRRLLAVSCGCASGNKLINNTVFRSRHLLPLCCNLTQYCRDILSFDPLPQCLQPRFRRHFQAFTSSISTTCHCVLTRFACSRRLDDRIIALGLPLRVRRFFPI